MTPDVLQTITTHVLPVLLAITVHEAAHGYAALYFGDDTAQRMGRLTLNPIAHIDLVGTIVIPALAMLLGGFLFGWAKPVPVNIARLRKPKQDMLWVAAAGPASNLLMALLWGLLLGATFSPASFSQPDFLTLMALAGVQINVVLMVINLLPLPPLDGGRILVSLLPLRQANAVARIEPYGMVILIVMAVTGVLTMLTMPLIQTIARGFITLILYPG